MVVLGRGGEREEERRRGEDEWEREEGRKGGGGGEERGRGGEERKGRKGWRENTLVDADVHVEAKTNVCSCKNSSLNDKYGSLTNTFWSLAEVQCSAASSCPTSPSPTPLTAAFT